MSAKSLLVGIPMALMAACGDDPTEPAVGTVSIVVQQSLTGETTSAGSFTMSGTWPDQGTTNETLVFGGPLTQSPVPVTFRRTLTGRNGTLILTGKAQLAFTSPTAATLSGTWEVESGSGSYAKGSGSLTGSANFGATPPTANITYAGSLAK